MIEGLENENLKNKITKLQNELKVKNMEINDKTSIINGKGEKGGALLYTKKNIDVIERIDLKEHSQFFHSSYMK